MCEGWVAREERRGGRCVWRGEEMGSLCLRKGERGRSGNRVTVFREARIGASFEGIEKGLLYEGGRGEGVALYVIRSPCVWVRGHKRENRIAVVFGETKIWVCNNRGDELFCGGKGGREMGTFCLEDKYSRGCCV